jgi:hypothetical protein
VGDVASLFERGEDLSPFLQFFLHARSGCPPRPSGLSAATSRQNCHVRYATLASLAAKHERLEVHHVHDSPIETEPTDDFGNGIEITSTYGVRVLTTINLRQYFIDIVIGCLTPTPTPNLRDANITSPILPFESPT